MIFSARSSSFWSIRPTAHFSTNESLEIKKKKALRLWDLLQLLAFPSYHTECWLFSRRPSVRRACITSQGPCPGSPACLVYLSCFLRLWQESRSGTWHAFSPALLSPRILRILKLFTHTSWLIPCLISTGAWVRSEMRVCDGDTQVRCWCGRCECFHSQVSLLFTAVSRNLRIVMSSL